LKDLRLLKKLIRPLIAAFLLFLLFRTGLIKLDQLKQSVQNTTLMLSGFILIGANLMFFGYRWKTILVFYKNIPFIQIMRLNLISQFFNIFIPGGVGGDVVKALELSKSDNIPRQKTIASVIVDRVLGLYCMILFSTLFLFLKCGESITLQKYFYTSLFMLIVATVGLYYMERITEISNTFSTKLNSKILSKITSLLKTISDGFKTVSNKKTFSIIILTSFMAQIMSVTFLYMVLKSIVPEPPSPFLFFPLACFAFMASAVPLTPGGIGFGQTAFYFIFSFFGTEIANAAVIGVSLMQLFSIIFSLPGAYFFTKIPKENKLA
jgi:uncharacterized protein (TIRG00374 family)